MPESRQQTLDQPGLVQFLSVPEHPSALTLPKAGPLARAGVFVKAKKRGQYDIQKSIRGYIKHLLDKIHGDKWVGPEELGQHLGISSRYVSQMRVNGLFVDCEKGKYNLDKCRIAYINHIRQIAETGGKSLSDERTRLTRLQADHEELKLQKARGFLIHTDTALEIWGLILSAFKSKIEAVGVRMNPIIDNIETKKDKTEAKEEIETLHKEALNELSNINSADYADDQQSDEPSEAPARSLNKRVGRPKKVSKPGVVKRARKVANKKG